MYKSFQFIKYKAFLVNIIQKQRKTAIISAPCTNSAANLMLLNIHVSDNPKNTW